MYPGPLFVPWHAGSARLKHPSREEGVPLVLAEAAPDTEGLARHEGALSAQIDNRALPAEALGGLGPSTARVSPLALGVEEEVGVRVAASARVLPLPLGLSGSGHSQSNFRHANP